MATTLTKPRGSTRGRTGSGKSSTASPSDAGSAAVEKKPAPFAIQSREEAFEYLNLLIYGDYGVGKTYLAGTASEVPMMSDVLLLNAEAGDLTLQVDEHNFQAIDSVRVTDYETASKVYDFLKAHCTARDAGDVDKLREMESWLRGTDPDKIKKPKEYRTVIVDSLTEVGIYCLNQLLGISDSTQMNEETNSAEWADYGKSLNMVTRMVRNFRDLDMHVIMICSQKWTQDETKKMLYHPAMTGQLADKVQGFMDMVGYYALTGTSEDGSAHRRLYVAPTGRFKAKCRISSFKSAQFDNPTMSAIVDAIGLSNE